jgi:hypothetical protein
LTDLPPDDDPFSAPSSGVGIDGGARHLPRFSPQRPPQEAIDLLLKTLRGTDLNNHVAVSQEFDRKYGRDSAVYWIDDAIGRTPRPPPGNQGIGGAAAGPTGIGGLPPERRPSRAR